MKKLVFCGNSDDTFGEVETFNDTFDTCAREVPVRYMVESGDESMIVVGHYVDPGVWSVGIAPSDEDAPLPSWPMLWEAGGYTAALSVTVPDDATVRCMNREDDE